MKKVKIERTKTGIPAMWESGGGYTNTGKAVIITDGQGDPKPAVYIKRRGELANREHALIPIETGDHIITADHHRRDFHIDIYRITDISGDTATAEKLHEYSRGKWTEPDISRVFEAWETNDIKSIKDIDDEIYNLCQAILSAETKATCYHCREPHYIAR